MTTSVQYPYRAVICGEEHIIKGWRGRKLLTDKGSFFVRHIYGDWQIRDHRIFEVAMIQSNGKGSWLVNGKNFPSIESLPTGARLSAIPDDEDLRVYKDKICAVAWLQTQNTGTITELLDSILKFWKLTQQPKDASKDGKHDIQSALWEFSRAMSDLSTYQRVFIKQWSRPIWLTEFRPRGQKIPLSPEGKKLTIVTAELEEKTAQLRKVESAASDSLKEALSRWLRFNPTGMAAETAAKIEKAVKLYVTEPEKRSLAKIAAEFAVTRKTVSSWFKRFSKETGYPVVTHRRHVSVREQLQADLKQDEEE